MFTGIVEEVGRISRLQVAPQAAVMEISATSVVADAEIGDSIAVNGVCLTVTGLGRDGFAVDLSAETLRRTNLGDLHSGSPVNLERSVSFGGKMGGHFVQGHVDGVGTVAQVKTEGEGKVVRFHAPPEVMRYVVSKGYVGVDGMSLTVVEPEAESFAVAFIPHTLAHTVAQFYRRGVRVNLEADVLGKYVEKFVAGRLSTATGITRVRLEEAGFIYMKQEFVNGGRFIPAPGREALLDGMGDVETAIKAFRAGEMLIVVDDANRENEGDLIQAAELVTADSINFMARFARGLICVAMTGERLDQLQIPLMVQNNQTPHRTAFTVSVEAASGVTTGISAADRARTVQVLAHPKSRPADLVQPGHIFPLRAQPGGVLARPGHTEAGVDLARLTGLQPAAAICEVMNDDGTMARLPDLLAFAALHNIQIVSIAQIIDYRRRTEKLVQPGANKHSATWAPGGKR